MFGAAPGRETIFIFCIRWINCSRLYIISSSSFSRDGESIFKKKIKIKPRGERRSPVLLEDQWAPRQECVWCFYSQTDRLTDNSTLIHPTDSPAFNLLFTFSFGFFDKRTGWEVDPRAEMWNSLCPLTKVLYRLSFFKPLLCLLFFCFCLFVVVVVVRQHGILPLAKWRWKSK